MHFTEAQSIEVKAWVIKRLEDISDADSDVLADYVLALLRSDASDDDIRKNSVENLEDFLKENTQKFVDDLFAKYAPKPTQSTTARLFSSPPISPVYSPSESAPPIQAYQPIRQGDLANAEYFGFNQSRKRSYNDSQGLIPELQHGSVGRPPKASRPRKAGRDDRFLGRSSFSQTIPQPAPFQQSFSNWPVPPTPPPGFPPLDMNDPMATFLAMQAMFPQPAGSPPTTSLSNGRPSTWLPGMRTKQRCEDYDTKGFCILGSACPYEHGNDHIVAPADHEEYDPKNAVIKTESINGRSTQPLSRASDKAGGRKKGMDRGAFAARRPNRAVFSDPRLPDDRNITTIVVEQIPEENFEEDEVRKFFSHFGSILEVTMKAYKHLAIVKYQTHGAAKRAWESPKVIFENRFVKVYWYRPDLEDQANGAAISKPNKSSKAVAGSVNTADAPMTAAALEAIKLKQEVKQKEHEDRLKAFQKMEATKKDILRQKEDMARTHDEEKSVLLAKIAMKEGKKPGPNGTLSSPRATSNGANGAANGGSSNTQALRDQLAQLEAEAKSMGIDPNAVPDESSSSFYDYYGHASTRGFSSRGRGFSSRGRANFGGYESTRGVYRGSAYTRGRGSAVRKLDNRPRKIAVTEVDFDAPKTEMLRLYLTGLVEYEGIEHNSEKTGSVIVSFRERWMAEQLMNGKTEIPGVGKVKLSWVASSRASSSSSMTAISALMAEHDPAATGGDEIMEEPSPHEGKDQHGQDDSGHQEMQEENLDVAGDDDWDNVS